MKKGRLKDGFGPSSLNSKEDVSPSRRFHLLLPSELEARLHEFANRHGLSLAAALRELVGQALAGHEGQTEARRAESPLLLATLLAAEHAVLMVASVLPEGDRRRAELAAKAAAAAQERIQVLEADQ